MLPPFLMIDQANKIKSFKTTFLIANISLRMIFKMFSLILNTADVSFLK